MGVWLSSQGNQAMTIKENGMKEVTFELSTNSLGRQELRAVCETAFMFTNLIKNSYLDHGHMHWIEELGFTVRIVKETK